MRSLIALLALAGCALAQDAKTAAPAITAPLIQSGPSPKTPTAKELTEPASDSLNRAMAEMLLLEEQYKIKEFQTRAKAIRDRYEARIMLECAAVGVVAKTFAELKGRCEVNPEASKEYPLGVLMWVSEKKETP